MRPDVNLVTLNAGLVQPFNIAVVMETAQWVQIQCKQQHMFVYFS